MDKTFGELTKDEKKALMGAWVDGETIEYFSEAFGEWKETAGPCWVRTAKYRIKPKPPVVKTHVAYGSTYSQPSGAIYWNSVSDGGASLRLTIIEIDGVVQPNALVEKL